MVKKHISIILTSICLLGVSLQFSCTKFNSGAEEDFTEEGCPVNEQTKKVKNDYNVNFYLETSGSMFGFMPANAKTDFQTQTWDIISSLRDNNGKSLHLYQIRSKEENVLPIQIEDFRNDMNSGRFQSSRSTDIPQMLDSILKKGNNQTVSVLTSDLIFSPDDGSPALLDQISADIRSRFIHKGLACVIFQQFSDYRFKNGSVVTVSPYYTWLMGPPELVNELSNKIRVSLKQYHEIDFGLPQHVVRYSLMPNANPVQTATAVVCTDNQLYYAYGGWDGTSDAINMQVALNLDGFSREVLEKEYLKKHIVIMPGTFKAEVSDVLPASKMTSKLDGTIQQQIGATHQLNLKVSSIQNEAAELSVNIENEAPSWPETYNLDRDDNKRTKTCGLLKMIKGLQDAYPFRPYLLERPLHILITQKEQ